MNRWFLARWISMRADKCMLYFPDRLVGFVFMRERADVPDQRGRIAAIKPATAPRTLEYIVSLLIECV